MTNMRDTFSLSHFLVSFFSSLVHPPPGKEVGQEGACERADLSAVPLDTTGQGHHGGVFEGLESLFDFSYTLGI